MTEDQLFDRWQSLDSEERNIIFLSPFERIQNGTKVDREAAEKFLMERV